MQIIVCKHAGGLRYKGINFFASSSYNDTMPLHTVIYLVIDVEKDIALKRCESESEQLDFGEELIQNEGTNFSIPDGDEESQIEGATGEYIYL